MSTCRWPVIQIEDEERQVNEKKEHDPKNVVKHDKKKEKKNMMYDMKKKNMREKEPEEDEEHGYQSASGHPGYIFEARSLPWHDTRHRVNCNICTPVLQCLKC